jgi:hypothetical protein
MSWPLGEMGRQSQEQDKSHNPDQERGNSLCKGTEVTWDRKKMREGGGKEEEELDATRSRRAQQSCVSRGLCPKAEDKGACTMGVLSMVRNYNDSCLEEEKDKNTNCHLSRGQCQKKQIPPWWQQHAAGLGSGFLMPGQVPAEHEGGTEGTQGHDREGANRSRWSKPQTFVSTWQ